MGKTRVLIVDDSLTIRKRFAEVLSADPDIELVGEAEDGKRAIEICLAERPDVITMDMMLPVMTGLAATEYIMAYCPTPILVVSSSTNRGELFKTYDALAAGAVDVIEKTDGSGPVGEWERLFVETVKLVARIRVITHPRARLETIGCRSAAPAGRAPSPDVSRHKRELIAIGTSTGGPGALVEILRGLPADFRLPILIVLHLNEPFGIAFADWLDGQTKRRVAYARDGDPIAAGVGRVVMAPPGRHLVVRQDRLCLTQGPERHFCRPSVDVLFESVAQHHGAAAVACLLTGMGSDGATGLLQVRQSGGLTIAQDQKTSVIYGMPREAALLGAATHVLPLDEIGPALAAIDIEARA